VRALHCFTCFAVLLFLCFTVSVLIPFPFACMPKSAWPTVGLCTGRSLPCAGCTVVHFGYTNAGVRWGVLYHAVQTRCCARLVCAATCASCQRSEAVTSPSCGTPRQLQQGTRSSISACSAQCRARFQGTAHRVRHRPPGPRLHVRKPHPSVPRPQPWVRLRRYGHHAASRHSSLCLSKAALGEQGGQPPPPPTCRHPPPAAHPAPPPRRLWATWGVFPTATSLCRT